MIYSRRNKYPPLEYQNKQAMEIEIERERLPTKMCIKSTPCLHQISAKWALNMMLYC